jgi:hypothetical protein
MQAMGVSRVEAVCCEVNCRHRGVLDARLLEARMNHTASELERAFELARSGKFTAVEELRRHLRRYSGDQILRKALLKQLQDMMKAARRAERGDDA